MRSTLASLLALLVSYAILCLGHGLNNTLLGVRAIHEGFPDWVIGVMMSSYFLGFLIGAHVAGRMIPVVGQIRVFAAFASLASAVSLMHVLNLNQFTWIVLRFVYGMSIATLYVVIEGWLSTLSTRENRGKLLAVYMIINFACLSLGQLLMLSATPQSFTLFAVVSILISVALVPLTLSKSKQPESGHSEDFGYRRLFEISPLATLGCFSTGLTMGAFWGLGAAYFSRMGLSPDNAAIALSVAFLGGLLFQWPIGALSDHFDRRVTISFVVVSSALVCLGFVVLIDDVAHQLSNDLLILSFFFGGFSYTLYSLYIALANDFLQPAQAVKASGGLISIHAVGAILGPTLTSLLMSSSIGNKGLFGFIGAINGGMFLLAVYQLYRGRTIPESTHEAFICLPKTTATLLELDPRTHEMDEADA